MARLYVTNPGLDPDHRLARFHLELLADNGVMGGLYGLGILYRHGIGVPEDMTKAATCFKQAIEGGHLMAAVQLRQISEERWPAKMFSALKTTWKIIRVPKTRFNELLNI